MEIVKFGFVSQGSVQIVERNSKLFIRYDAGAHQVVWREDEISKEEFLIIKQNEENIEPVLFKLQDRLIKSGIVPNVSNWNPE